MKNKVTKKNGLNLAQYGAIVFSVGLLFVIVGSILQLGEASTKVLIGLLVLMGIAVGFLNVSNEEAIVFMLATIVLVMILGQSLGLVAQFMGTYQQGFIRIAVGFVTYLNALMVPASVVVAIKSIYAAAKDN